MLPVREGPRKALAAAGTRPDGAIQAQTGGPQGAREACRIGRAVRERLFGSAEKQRKEGAAEEAHAAEPAEPAAAKQRWVAFEGSAV
ncbi:uncharacterized protein ASCRUDRAFT_128562 [Ascoidea rubescens DSM 1968]|uniref:Uncharacterized protein n=1 Tax=Ascoidea rubescens DSM 1968 TaxID=1344418 RepID=A0A1D2V9M7_9ASCO|nr:hypothetical protein ASCRUDRAFT_128562 [Ascoidea rubescens DSM 1968]ODV58197.1 hypothetical protein ASCRUDRAFT_128562 [Ascoidea rubescens DSM 1968]